MAILCWEPIGVAPGLAVLGVWSMSRVVRLFPSLMLRNHRPMTSVEVASLVSSPWIE